METVTATTTASTATAALSGDDDAAGVHTTSIFCIIITIIAIAIAIAMVVGQGVMELTAAVCCFPAVEAQEAPHLPGDGGGGGSRLGRRRRRRRRIRGGASDDAAPVMGILVKKALGHGDGDGAAVAVVAVAVAVVEEKHGRERQLGVETIGRDDRRLAAQELRRWFFSAGAGDGGCSMDGRNAALRSAIAAAAAAVLRLPGLDLPSEWHAVS
jgi:hypothetical protein